MHHCLCSTALWQHTDITHLSRLLIVLNVCCDRFHCAGPEVEAAPVKAAGIFDSTGLYCHSGCGMLAPQNYCATYGSELQAARTGADPLSEEFI